MIFFYILLALAISKRSFGSNFSSASFTFLTIFYSSITDSVIKSPTLLFITSLFSLNSLILSVHSSSPACLVFNLSKTFSINFSTYFSFPSPIIIFPNSSHFSLTSSSISLFTSLNFFFASSLFYSNFPRIHFLFSSSIQSFFNCFFAFPSHLLNFTSIVYKVLFASSPHLFSASFITF